MIIDTEKDRITLSITLDDALDLLGGKTLSDEGWKHLAGVLGEWYHDTWLERHEDPKEKEARISSYDQSQKHILKENRILTARECGCDKCMKQ